MLKEIKPNKKSLIQKVLKGYSGKNKLIIKGLLENSALGNYISINLNKGTDITGEILDLFYPVRDSMGVKVNEAQAEEVALYQDIKSWEILEK